MALKVVAVGLADPNPYREVASFARCHKYRVIEKISTSLLRLLFEF